MVLFPGINIPLHIFEERYKQLINECIDADEPFGIVLIRDDDEPEESVRPYEVGTSAWISEVERLDDGRMNIIVEGGRRFRIRDIVDNRPYLSANVEFLDPEVDYDLREAPLMKEVSLLFADYVERLVTLSGHKLYKLELPDDPESLSSMVGSLLAVPPEDRQSLLEDLNITSVLAREADMLQEQIQGLELAVEAALADPAPIQAVPVTADRYRSMSGLN